MSLLIVGTVAFDSIKTPFGKIDKTVGGAATYIGLSASYFTKKSGIVSVVGDDFPEDTIKEFNRRGIDTNGIEVVKGGKSFYWSGSYHTDMNTRDTLITDLNVLADFNPVVPNSYQGSEFLMLGNVLPSLQISVVQQLKTRPRLIAMDTMNFWMDNALPDLKKLLTMVDVLLVNDSEARQLS